MEPIVFYDVPRVPAEGDEPTNRAFSGNTWKTRYIFNMKGIPYKTEWVEYPDVADTLKSLGLGPTSVYHGTPFYTVPTINDPNTKHALTDSQAIALYLDEQYPQAPVLFPPRTRALQLAQTAHLQQHLLLALFPLLVREIHAAMTPIADPYIRTTREAFFGRKLEDIAPAGSEERAGMLKAAEAVLDEMASAIKAGGGEGALFFGGDQPVYVDVFVAAALAPFVKIAGKESDVTRMITAASGGHWVKFLEYFKKYEEVH